MTWQRDARNGAAMIRLDGLCAVYGEVWYDEPLPDGSGVDIALHRQRSTPLADGRCVPFSSLVSDLALDGESILARFGKETRYEIRRAEKKDGLQAEFLPQPGGRLEEFCRFQESFARQKGLGPIGRSWLASACRAGRLALSTAVHDRRVLVWHAYLLGGRTARLQHSSSHFREGDRSYRTLVGRANRWLHWRDMQRFKDMGMELYDWGGLFDDESAPERAGINEFKRGFGGRYERTYDCTVPLTLRGRLWLPVRDAWRELARMRCARRGPGVHRLERRFGGCP